jgi:hypothetical protein
MLQRSVARAASRRAAFLAVSKSLLQPRIPIRHQSTAPATIIDRGFWRSLIPKPLRKENRQHLKTRSKEWNPATFFIVIFLLIGSMSIQMIALRNSFNRYMRQSDVKIGQLREVVERIKNGEKVDVEQVLGTENPEKEEDWEEGELTSIFAKVLGEGLTWEPVLRSIERADGVPKAPKKKAKQSKSEPETTKVEKATEEEQKPASVTAQATAKPSSSFGNFF